MKCLSLRSAIAAVFATVIINGVLAQVAGSHTSLNRWCGKPYQTGSPNYNPGGQTHPPPASPSQLLYVQVQPRYNIYVDTETSASFLVSATLSRTYGKPFVAGKAGDILNFDIAVKGSGEILVKNGQIAVDAKNMEFPFSLSLLESRMAEYNIVLTVTSDTGDYDFSATTELFYLPDKKPGTGSVTKLDNLYGGMLFKNKASGYVFEPLLGVGFYTNYGGYLAQNKSNIQTYYDSGFRTIHPIAGYNQPSSPPYNPLNLSQVWDEADALNLLWVYDMRGVFMNTTQVAIEVAANKDRETLYMWYSGDEPDVNDCADCFLGWEYALDSTKNAYDTIRSIDLYHPVGLVLNCYDFYFKQYSAGADIIMEDAYPIAINATFSYTWGIPCNSTYGDCGCDDCHGVVQDVSDRLDAFATYQADLGQQAKPFYAVQQAFSDGEYWPRIPRTNEVWSMNSLAFNHNAKSLQIWTFPTDESLVAANADYAAVVTVDPVRSFLLGGNPVPIAVAAMPKLDIAYWNQGEDYLVSFVNGYNRTVKGLVSIDLPFSVSTIDSQPFGTTDWSLSGSVLSVTGLTALETSMLILKV